MEVSQIYVEKQSMKFFLLFVMTMLGNKYRLLSQIKNAFFFPQLVKNTIFSEIKTVVP